MLDLTAPNIEGMGAIFGIIIGLIGLILQFRQQAQKSLRYENTTHSLFSDNTRLREKVSVNYMGKEEADLLSNLYLLVFKFSYRGTHPIEITDYQREISIIIDNCQEILEAEMVESSFEMEDRQDQILPIVENRVQVRKDQIDPGDTFIIEVWVNGYNTEPRTRVDAGIKGIKKVRKMEEIRRNFRIYGQAFLVITLVSYLLLSAWVDLTEITIFLFYIFAGTVLTFEGVQITRYLQQKLLRAISN